MKTILFFTAGAVPTTLETAAIAKLNALSAQQLRVRVMNGAAPADYGYGHVVGDYTAGTVPAEFGGNTPIYPTFDPDSPPTPANLVGTQAIVHNGQALIVDGGGGHTATLTIVAGVITSVVYA